MTPDELQQYIILASDQSASRRNLSSSILNSLHNSPDGGSQICAELLKHLFNRTIVLQNDNSQSQTHESVTFYALTTIQNALSKQKLSVEQRMDLRQIIFFSILRIGDNRSNSTETFFMPHFIRTKIGVVLALLIQNDFPERWPNAFEELIHCLVLSSAEQVKALPIHDEMKVITIDVFLRTMIGFNDEVVDKVQTRNTMIKDKIRGFRPVVVASADMSTPSTTVTVKIVEVILNIFHFYHPLIGASQLIGGEGKYIYNAIKDLAVLCVSTLKRFISWVDLNLIVNERVVSLLFSCLAPIEYETVSNEIDDDSRSFRSRLAVQAIECLIEIISRGMDQGKKVALIFELNILERIHESGVDLEKNESSISMMIKVAELINLTGLALLPYWEATQLNLESMATLENEKKNALVKIMQQLMPTFFKCFTYDHIDVSGSIIPLAYRLIVTLQKEKNVHTELPLSFLVSSYLPQILSIMYEKMKYPPNFNYDCEDENETAEELYRIELRKLNQIIIQTCPDLSLHFLRETVSHLTIPLSCSPTSEIESVLRLVYHFCEGIRPLPGNKTVVKIENFKHLLISLHSSDIILHPHHQVLVLYYEITVRYSSIFKEYPSLLPGILSAISGQQGVQHTHPIVKSRSCYLLLKLVKAMSPMMKNYVEAAVIGIQGLLSDPTNCQLKVDDSLYLFEVIGLLVGNNDIDAIDQQRHLTAVIKPHIQSIEKVLNSNIQKDFEHTSDTLSMSVAAIAFLSKGFKKPIVEVKFVLIETVPVCLKVLTMTPGIESLRNKIIIYLQRMILCLDREILYAMPRFLMLLIEHCDSQDIIDVSQLLYQICSKFKEEAISVIDPVVIPFLQKCQALMLHEEEIEHTDKNTISAYILPEQMKIKKMMVSLLQHIVVNGVTPILLSVSNAPAIKNILQLMNEGASDLAEPVMQRSCIKFFREIINQWGREAMTSSKVVSVQKDFMCYVEDFFLPGMIRMLLTSDFDEKSAMQYRILNELAGVLSALKSHYDGNEFHRKILVKTFTFMKCPDMLISRFSQACTSIEMENCLKMMLVTLKY